LSRSVIGGGGRRADLRARDGPLVPGRHRRGVPPERPLPGTHRALLLFWRERRRDRYLLLSALLTGLCLTNHLTSGLLLPAALLFVGLVERRKLLDWRLMLKAAGLFFLGLTPYLYLPVRAWMNAPFEGTTRATSSVSGTSSAGVT
jgi:hypothetical protein